MGKTYNQTIQSHELSMAIERFMIAAYPQAFSAARVDIDSPPAGFVDLGAVVEDTPSVTITREVYELKTGIPKVTQLQVVTEMSAEVSFSCYSNTNFHAQFSLGNDTSITTVTTIASGAVATEYYGKSTLQKFALLGVADFLNGSQVIHDFTKVAPSGDWTEEIRPSDAYAIPMTFSAMGVSTTINSCTELILGKRHYINGDGETCTVTA